MSRLKITRNSGFRMTFDNGVTASVQFGFGNYCNTNDDLFNPPREVESPNAEVAALYNGGFISSKIDDEMFACDDVCGYLTANEILDFLNKCANYNPEC